MTIWAPLLAVFALAVPIAQDPSPAPSVRFSDGARFLRVIDHGATPGNVERLTRVVHVASPVLEEVCGFPLPLRTAIVVSIFPDHDATGGYAGQNDGTKIEVQEDIADLGMVHEIAHYWFSRYWVRDSGISERWITEGLAEFAALEAARRIPSLGDPVHAHADHLHSWTSGIDGEEPLLRRGIPRYPMPGGEEGMAFARDWYARAYAFFHLLAARIGTEALAEVNARFAQARPAGGSARYLAELARVEPDIVALVRGWHTVGEFHADMHPDLLADSDGDWLSAAEERALGTDPARADSDGDGAHDGEEVYLHATDPLVAEGADAPPARAYVIDGELGDWDQARTSARYRYDLPGDLQGEAPDPHDLRAAWVDVDGPYLTGVFRLEHEPRGETRIEFGVDFDADTVFDRSLTIREGGEAWVTRLDGDWQSSDWHRLAMAEVAWSGADVEFAVPLEAFGEDLPGSVTLWAYTLFRPPLADDYVYADEIHDWIPLTIP